MAVIEDASFSTRVEAVKLVLREVNLAELSPEAADWFVYVKDLFNKIELYDRCDGIIRRELARKFKGLEWDDWEGTWQYIPVPHVKLVTAGLPHLSFEIDLYVAGSGGIIWSGDDEPLQCVVIAEVKKAVEKITLPLFFLKAAVDGELSQFEVVESEFNFTTWQVPGFERNVRLHNSLLPLWQRMFSKKALGATLVRFGLISPGQALLVDQVSANKAPEVDKSVYTKETALDSHKLRARLQELGFTENKIDEVIGADFFPDGCSLEDAIKLALQSFDRG